MQHALPYSTPPILESPGGPQLRLAGPLGARIKANAAHWLRTAPDANPAMLGMFRDRDRVPPRDLVPWAGEFAGKYLISLVQALRMVDDDDLRDHARRFVTELIATQREDGYLGPFPREEQMMGPGRWDLWGQYHVMLGLLLWSQDHDDASALSAVRRCADHFCRTFLDDGHRTAAAGSEEMNQSSSHVFALLYRCTGDPRYLEMLRAIEADWQAPPAGDYVRASAAGLPFHATPKPRWESLHSVQAIAELAMLTSEPVYGDAFEQIWWSIAEGDRHNTGGFSSGEQATGNPYDPGAIETCCTIAWMAITIDRLRMTGDPRAAEELEIATWNAVLGAQSPSGRWWTYNTPMDGDRKASAHEIVFQARPGSPELNCCSVNAPRGLGMLSEWAVMLADDGIALNLAAPGEYRVTHPRFGSIGLRITGDYPVSGEVTIELQVEQPTQFAIHVRVPSWSQHTALRGTGGETVIAPAGDYAVVSQIWSPGDRLQMALDMRPWLWIGERECSARASIYRGPILLAFDPARNAADTPAALDPGRLQDLAPTACRTGGAPPILLVEAPALGGGSMRLCDFASAGATGTTYRSWLNCDGPPPAPFSPANPWRRTRAECREDCPTASANHTPDGRCV